MTRTLPTSFVFVHDTLGQVHVTRRTSSSRVSGRWKDGRAHFNVPSFLDSAGILDAIGQLAPRMLASRPSIKFHDGQTIALDGLSFGISTQRVSPDSIICTLRGDAAYLEVGCGMDFDDSATTEAISRMMRRMAAKCAARILIPHAQTLASALGLKVRSWDIMNGHHVLGRCSSDRRIQLSYMNVFLPVHLREYIVYHELAHLTEMNHSARFHALCDTYCSGREARLIKELKSYSWPLLRR